MMRLPLFEFRAPRTIEEATRILDGEGANAMPLAGGTDLLPNMKRRQQVPRALMSLRHIESLNKVQMDHSATRLGACLTLAEIAADPRLRNGLSALSQAASFVATPHIRNMATLGGNLCLDTRCNYYDQNYEWRKSINFCLKKDGTVCHVVQGGQRCVAAASNDTAPVLMSLGARVGIVGPSELDQQTVMARGGWCRPFHSGEGRAARHALGSDIDRRRCDKGLTGADAERQEREVDRHVDDYRVYRIVPDACDHVVGGVGLEV